MLRTSPISVVFACILVACAVSRATADDGETARRKSTIVAAPFLKSVDKFQRRVVFFNKDVDLPCLRLPEPGQQPPLFFESTRAFGLRGLGSFGEGVQMTSDGRLVFLSAKTILFVNERGRAEKLAGLADLAVAGPGTRPENLHFGGLVAASPAAAILYITLSNSPGPGEEPSASSVQSSFLGRLDLKTRRLLLVPDEDGDLRDGPAEIDPDAGLIYQAKRARTLECRDFDGKSRGHWSLPRGASAYHLSADRRTMLVSGDTAPVTILDLKSGSCTDLPISGRFAIWGPDRTVFYVAQTSSDGDVLDRISLFRYRVGDKRPTRLFLVSCQSDAEKGGVLGGGGPPTETPRLSADRSWLSWHCWGEDSYHESQTILLDTSSNEYRVLQGRWLGVQMD